MVDETPPSSAAPEDVVVQLLRVISEIDLEVLGEDLRRLDGATTRRAVTGASLLAEALTRATLGSESLAAALGTEFTDPPRHEPHRTRGQRIEVHDDQVGAADDITNEA